MFQRTTRIGTRIALATSISMILVAGTGTAAHAVVPPPPAIGTGTSGTVVLSPNLGAGESLSLTTSGLSAGRLLAGEYASPGSAGHSGVTVEDDGETDNLILSGQVLVSNATMVRFESVASDPSVDLEMQITWIEQGDLNVGGQWTVNTGDVDRLDAPGYPGLWIVDIWQRSGPAGIVFDTTATVVKNGGAPLTLSPSTVTAASPTATASWKDLEPYKTYLATVDWGSPQQRSIVEVRTGAANVATTTTARLSSSLHTGKAPTYLITRVSPDGADNVRGQLRLRVDGVIRATMEISASSARTFTLLVPALPPGLHEVKAEFRPLVPGVDPSNSPLRRLLVVRT